MELFFQSGTAACGRESDGVRNRVWNGRIFGVGMGFDRIARALGIQEDQLARALPFFGVYTLLFVALTMADAIAVTLLASRIGASALPQWYSLTAIANLVLIGAYLTRAARTDSGLVFGWILGTVATLWMLAWAAAQLHDGIIPLGMLFVTREVALTMILMHFGTFLQDYFVRNELNRILPVIYAGGRVGGILGGIVVGSLAPRWGTVNLVLITVALVLVAWVAVQRIYRTTAHRDEPDDPPLACPSSGDPAPSRMTSTRRFLYQVGTVPLLGWLTISTLCFVGCRWFMAYQYTAYFEVHFQDEAELAVFLGRYTQVALGISLLLQLFLVNRLVGWLGVSTTHLLYSLAMMGGLLGNALAAGLPMAVASRFIEAELRFGLRNPVHQMMANRFGRSMRILIRGWTLGLLIPIGTLIASAAIASLLKLSGAAAVGIVGTLLGLAYVLAAVYVGRAYQQHREP